MSANPVTATSKKHLQDIIDAEDAKFFGSVPNRLTRKWIRAPDSPKIRTTFQLSLRDPIQCDCARRFALPC
jgi:hypothetical protein